MHEPSQDPELMALASQVRLVIFDVDGVLTDGRLYFGPEGETLKRFDSHDGHGIRMLLFHGFRIAVISGRHSEAVAQRMADLGIEHVLQGHRDKRKVFGELLNELQITPAETAYVGDDVVDLQVITRVKLAIAVQNAHPKVKRHCHWVTDKSGGGGAAREVCEAILEAHGLLDEALNYYLADARA